MSKGGNTLLVAKKKYSYENYDYLNEEKQIDSKKGRNKKNKNRNLLIKMSAILWVVTISAALIFILLRYTSITEAEYKVYSLNKEITKLEDHLQDVKVELDSLTRSNIIEEAAAKDLNMQYPQYQQMVFLNLDNTPDLDLTIVDDFNPSNDELMKEQNQDKKLFDYVKVSIRKLYSLLD